MKFSGKVGKWQWANERLNFVVIRITDADTDPDPYRDTVKTCLCGGMHCSSASSFILFLTSVVTSPLCHSPTPSGQWVFSAHRPIAKLTAFDQSSLAIIINFRPIHNIYQSFNACQTCRDTDAQHLVGPAVSLMVCINGNRQLVKLKLMTSV